MIRIELFEATSLTVLADIEFQNVIQIAKEDLLTLSLTLVKFAVTTTGETFQKALIQQKICMTSYVKNSVVAVVLYSENFEDSLAKKYAQVSVDEMLKKYRVMINELRDRKTPDDELEARINTETRKMLNEEKARICGE